MLRALEDRTRVQGSYTEADFSLTWGREGICSEEDQFLTPGLSKTELISQTCFSSFFPWLLIHPVAQARKHGNHPTLLLTQAINSITKIYWFYLLNFPLIYLLLSELPLLWSKTSPCACTIANSFQLVSPHLRWPLSVNLTLKSNPITTSFKLLKPTALYWTQISSHTGLLSVPQMLQTLFSLRAFEQTGISVYNAPHCISTPGTELMHILIL